MKFIVLRQKKKLAKSENWLGRNLVKKQVSARLAGISSRNL
jgi:hypothetical protein